MENYAIIFCSLLILTTTITIHPISGATDFSFSTDKTVYLQRDTIFITGEATKVSNYKGTIEVVNTLGATIRFIEFVIPADKTTFSSQIGIFGAEWNKDGLYQVVVTIDEETRTKLIHIFSTSSGIKSSISSTIGFDKSRYSWTDTVTIYLIGHSYNLNNKLTESLGDSKEKHIKISTSQGTLDSYKLVETAPDSGIFSGEIIDIPKGSSVYVTVIKPDKTADQLKVRISNNNEFQAQWIIDKESQEGVYLASASYGDIASGQVGFEIIKTPEKIITKRIAVPEWIKNSAKWWANNQISDQDFTDGLAFLIKEGTIKVEKKSVKQTTSDKIPEWVKNTARWWSEGSIGNEDFVKGIEYLIENGIIKV